MKQEDLRDMFTKVSYGVYSSAVVISPDPLSSSPTTSSALENREDDPDDPEATDEGDIQMVYYFDSCTVQVFKQ
jgi:hypothetical protein